ncbi:MAG: hypothetical protein QXY40_07595 [Candidatus Methanomethylicia archaeon]
MNMQSKAGVKWIMFVFLILYVLTFIFSFIVVLLYSFLRASPVDYTSFLRFSSIYSFIFSIVCLLFSILYLRRNKSVEDLIREEIARRIGDAVERTDFEGY